jgi:SAM-dependent methyltransferase
MSEFAYAYTLFDHEERTICHMEIKNDGSAGKLCQEGTLDGVSQWLQTLPLEAKSRIADVGAGRGYHSQFLSAMGYEVTAIDYNYELFDFHGSVEFIESDILELDPKFDSSFDVVFLSHTLEHFANFGLLLKKCYNLLKVGGYFIVVVPEYSPFAVFGHWNVGWNIGQLAATLTNSGFDCRKTSFGKNGINIYGYGIKDSTFPNNVDRELDLGITIAKLPEVVDKLLTRKDGMVFFDGDLVSLEEKSVERSVKEVNSDPGDKFCLGIFETLELTTKWEDLSIKTKGKINILDAIFTICLLTEHEVSLRVAFVDSDTKGVGQKWFKFNRGFNLITFRTENLEFELNSSQTNTFSDVFFGGNLLSEKENAKRGIYRASVNVQIWSNLHGRII